MKIELEYNNLTIHIDAKDLTSSLDAILVASAVLTQTQKLGYGTPNVKMDMKLDDRTRLSNIDKP